MSAQVKVIGYYVIAGVTVFVIGLSVGRFSKPTSIRTVTVDNKRIVDDKNVVTTVTQTTSPTTHEPVVTTTTVDKSVVITTDDKNTKKDVEYKHSDWLLSIGKDYNFNSKVSGYTAEAQRRILGPVYLGVYGSSAGQAGVILSLAF